MVKEHINTSFVFTSTHGYPRNLASNVMKKAEDKQEKEETLTPPQATSDQPVETSNEKTLMLKVPYTGKTKENLLKNLRNNLEKNLPSNIKCRIMQTGSKISRSFQLKDKIDDRHLSNFIYKHKCQNKKCTDSYRVVQNKQHNFKLE